MRRLSLTFLLLGLLSNAQAQLGLPLVDLAPHSVSSTANIPIWSSTNVTINAGDTLTVTLPTGWITPTALNLSSCECIFAKYGRTETAGTFSTKELTLTAGVHAGLTISVYLPVSFTPGPFYIRIDDYAAFGNPTISGTATVLLTHASNGVTLTTQSRPITIGDGLETIGQIDGYVYDNIGGVNTPIQGGLVVADTDAGYASSGSYLSSLPNWDMGPMALSNTARPTTEDRFSTVTSTNGRFTLRVPYRGVNGTTYHVAAFYYGSTATAAPVSIYRNRRSNVYDVPVVSPYTTPVPVTLTGFTSTSNN